MQYLYVIFFHLSPVSHYIFYLYRFSLDVYTNNSINIVIPSKKLKPKPQTNPIQTKINQPPTPSRYRENHGCASHCFPQYLCEIGGTMYECRLSAHSSMITTGYFPHKIACSTVRLYNLFFLVDHPLKCFR